MIEPFFRCRALMCCEQNTVVPPVHVDHAPKSSRVSPVRGTAESGDLSLCVTGMKWNSGQWLISLDIVWSSYVKQAYLK